MGKEIKGEVKDVDRSKCEVKIGATFYHYAENVGRWLNIGEKIRAKLSGKGDVIFVEKYEEGANPAPMDPKPRAQKWTNEDYWQDKTKHDRKRDARITRMACLNTATAVLKIAAEHGMEVSHKEIKSADERVVALAQKFEEFVKKAKPDEVGA